MTRFTSDGIWMKSLLAGIFFVRNHIWYIFKCHEWFLGFQDPSLPWAYSPSFQTPETFAKHVCCVKDDDWNIDFWQRYAAVQGSAKGMKRLEFEGFHNSTEEKSFSFNWDRNWTRSFLRSCSLFKPNCAEKVQEINIIFFLNPSIFHECKMLLGHHTYSIQLRIQTIVLWFLISTAKQGAKDEVKRLEPIADQVQGRL